MRLDRSTHGAPTHAFISYSQKDKRFVNKLAVDLQEAGLPITYDQWNLSPGDSILEKIEALIQTSFVVVCVISKNSLKSRWVREELKIAAARRLPILAIDIDESYKNESVLQEYIEKTLVADAHGNYLWALRQTLEALCPTHFYGYGRKNGDHSFSDALQGAIESGELSRVEDALSSNPDHLLQLFRPWQVRECIMRPECKSISPNIAIINGQSGRYECIYVYLAETKLSEKARYRKSIKEAKRFRPRKLQQYEVRRFAALGLRNSYGAHQIIEWGERPLSFSHLVLHGRRAEYDREDNNKRTALLERKRIDIASYDRLLDRL